MSSIGEVVYNAIREVAKKVKIIDEDMEELICSDEMYNCDNVFDIDKKGKLEIEAEKVGTFIEYEIEINIDNPKDYHKDIEVIVKKLTIEKNIQEPMLSIKNY